MFNTIQTKIDCTIIMDIFNIIKTEVSTSPVRTEFNVFNLGL